MKITEVPGDAAAFWVNMAVAIGTLGAAVAAVYSAWKAQQTAKEGLEQNRELAVGDRRAAIELASEQRQAAADLAAAEREHQRQRDFAERQYDREREALRISLDHMTAIGEAVLQFVMIAERTSNSPEAWQAMGVLKARLALQPEAEWPIARRIASAEDRHQNAHVYCTIAKDQYGITTADYVAALQAEVNHYVSRAGHDLGEHLPPAGPA